MMTTHFKASETVCRCGCGYNAPSSKLLQLAEKIRALLGVPMIVHCVCRCPEHNARVRGSQNSAHLDGKAMDFHSVRMPPEAAYKAILQEQKAGRLPDLGGIGLYDWGLHVDIVKARDGHLRKWDQRTKNGQPG